jgi:hypothetical protein
MNWYTQPVIVAKSVKIVVDVIAVMNVIGLYVKANYATIANVNDVVIAIR